MPDPADLDPDLTALAARLAGLTPAAPALDRDRLFFAAGRRAAGRRAWAWPLATGLCAALAFGSGARLAPTPAPARVPEIVSVQVPAPSAAPESPSTPPTPVVRADGDSRLDHPTVETLRLRDLLLLWCPPATVPVSARSEPIETVLGLQPGSLTDAQ